MKKAKHDRTINTQLKKRLHLYVYSEAEVAALNSFRSYRRHLPKWEVLEQLDIITLQRNYTHNGNEQCIPIQRYRLDKDHYVVECIFSDTAIQTWVFDNQMQPIVNVSN